MIKKNKDYRSIRPDPLMSDYEPRERIRIFSNIIIDRNVFKKSTGERIRLKEAKKASKLKIDL